MSLTAISKMLKATLLLYCNYSCRHDNSPVKVKRLTCTRAPRRPAFLPALPPRRSFPYSCTLDRIKCSLLPCGNTAFIGSDIDGTIFVPAIVDNTACERALAGKLIVAFVVNTLPSMELAYSLLRIRQPLNRRFTDSVESSQYSPNLMI